MKAFHIWLKKSIFLFLIAISWIFIDTETTDHGSDTYQFYSLWCDTTGGRIHNLSHMRRVCYPLHHRCGWELLQIVFYAQEVWHSPYTRHSFTDILLTSCVFNPSCTNSGRFDFWRRCWSRIRGKTMPFFSIPQGSYYVY